MRETFALRPWGSPGFGLCPKAISDIENFFLDENGDEKQFMFEIRKSWLLYSFSKLRLKFNRIFFKVDLSLLIFCHMWIKETSWAF